MNHIVELIRGRAHAMNADCPPNRWFDTLERHFAKRPPAFTCRWYGNLYRERAQDLGWLDRTMSANARKEAQGARTLRRLAAVVENTGTAELLLAHARDESRHARVYLQLQSALFDADDVGHDAYLGSSHRTRFGGGVDAAGRRLALVDEMIQINIGEMRTFVNQMLMRPFVAVLAEGFQTGSALMTTVDELLADEVAHIVYSGSLLETALDDQSTSPLLAQRLCDFEEYTRAELGLNTAN
jgi:hypothetical protein